MIRLGQAMDGRLVLGSNEVFPAPVKYVEYYREQRLFNLVFDTGTEDTRLLPHELCPRTAMLVKSSAAIMIIALENLEKGPYGYMAPLIQIGI